MDIISTEEVRDFAGYVETVAEKARYGTSWVRDHIIEQFGEFYLRAQKIVYECDYGKPFEKCVVDPYTASNKRVADKIDALENIARLTDLVAQMKELEDVFYPKHH